MPLARHDDNSRLEPERLIVSTHMPLARHDWIPHQICNYYIVSTHMPLARHDRARGRWARWTACFYSHASCEAWHGVRTLLFQSEVSTHMPLARHDIIFDYKMTIISVSTHMPLARHDMVMAGIVQTKCWFLLTCLLRGMTDFQPSCR